MSEYILIESASDLKKVVPKLKSEQMVAVDLEADSMFHFQEKVCLLQMATAQAVMIIDPLQVEDLSVLGPIFANPSIRKVFHGADYDVRSLYRDYKFEINNLFDTQLACMFLGKRETGLEAVLQSTFKVEVDKKYQRKDWSRRPLPEEMLCYAANDVHYLVRLAKILIEALSAEKRLAWVLEECEILSKVRPGNNDCQPLYLSFKGAGRLKPRQLAVLETVLQFRKKIASQKDRPLFKIIGNQSVLRLVQATPVNPLQLENSRALSKKQNAMYGNDLLAQIRKALAVPADKLPVYPRRKPPAVKPANPRRVKDLKSWRDRQAKTLQLEAGLLMNKALLNTIAVQNPISVKSLESIVEMKNWQRNVFGKEIINILNRRQR